MVTQVTCAAGESRTNIYIPNVIGDKITIYARAGDFRQRVVARLQSRPFPRKQAPARHDRRQNIRRACVQPLVTVVIARATASFDFQRSVSASRRSLSLSLSRTEKRLSVETIMSGRGKGGE